MPEPAPLVVRVLQLDPLCPVDRLGGWLAQAGATVDVVPVHEGAPVALAGADALVVLGGRMGAYDDAPQLAPARDALAGAVATGLLFCLLAAVLDSVWGLAAGAARDWFATSPQRLRRVGGTGGLMMIGLGATLALTGRRD